MKSRMKLNMFDDYWLDFQRDTVRRWFSPEVYSRVPKGCYGSLVFDAERKLYRVYYELPVSVDQQRVRHLWMIESRDLKNFTEPKLVFTGGSGLHGCSVMYDPYDPDSSRRYKFCGMTEFGTQEEGLSKKKVELVFSGDGIHFGCDHTHYLTDHTSDTLNHLFYDPVHGEYVLTHRAAYVDRRIAVSTSKDLEHWTEPHIMLQPSALYNDGYSQTQQYAMTAEYFDGIFYGLLWQYRTVLSNFDHAKMSGVIEPELVYSYDGREFLHTTGKTLIERPLAPEPGCTGLSPMDMCESADGKDYYLYISAANKPHAGAEGAARLEKQLKAHGIEEYNQIYRIRKDGFCGLECTANGGTVITKPVCLDEADLSFNVNAACGSVRFGIMQNGENFVPGFSFEDCVPLEFTDAVDAKPVWKEHVLSELLGQRVRIAVQLNTAILFCVTATARPCIITPQKSFAQPWTEGN